MPDFKTLLAAADSQDKTELTVMYNARVSALRAYQDRHDKATGDSFATAKKIYDDLVQQLSDKYFPKQARKDEREFKTQKDARLYLLQLGYRVSVGKFSQDSHKFTTGNGIILSSELVDYARQNLRKAQSNIDEGEDRDGAETRKARADADRAEIKRDAEQRELDKEWIKRADADLETCAWVSLMRDAIVNRLVQNLPTLIHAVGGHVDRLSDGQDVIDQVITDACNDISHSDEVDVEILDEDQG